MKLHITNEILKVFSLKELQIKNLSPVEDYDLNRIFVLDHDLNDSI
jgi:hypothetical protein